MNGGYVASPIKRVRWTNAQLAELDDAIIEAVEQDYPCTLRGVYYRVVSAGAVDKTDAGYNRVGRQLLKLRRSGGIDYRKVTDGTRWIRKPTTWRSMAEKLEHDQRHYRRAMWHDTPDEVQVFVEKDAIAGALLPVTEAWDVPLGVLRGYASESFAHSVARSVADSNLSRSGTTFVYQLGDHDPSGLDSWRDFQGKVAGFLEDLAPEVLDYVVFERIAVTTEQIDTLGLPSRPTKKKDSRAAGFEGGSVEVDAIPAPTLRQIVEDAILRHVDPHHLDVLRQVEAEEREGLARLAAGFGSA